MDSLLNVVIASIPLSILVASYSFYKFVNSYVSYNNHKTNFNLKLEKSLTDFLPIYTKFIKHHVDQLNTNFNFPYEFDMEKKEFRIVPPAPTVPPVSPVSSNTIKDDIEEDLSDLSDLIYPTSSKNENTFPPTEEKMVWSNS
jgi:hypothetical protein